MQVPTREREMLSVAGLTAPFSINTLISQRLLRCVSLITRSPWLQNRLTGSCPLSVGVTGL